MQLGSREVCVGKIGFGQHGGNFGCVREVLFICLMGGVVLGVLPISVYLTYITEREFPAESSPCHFIDAGCIANGVTYSWRISPTIIRFSFLF